MKNTILGIFLLALTFGAYEANSQAICLKGPDGRWYMLDNITPCPNTIITAVPFLRIVADARSGALGDAGIAISPDPNAVHFNDSKLVCAEKEFGVSATYTPWLRALGLNDVYLAYLTGYYKPDERQAFGMNLRYFSLGEINFTDINGEPLGNGRPREWEFKASYSRKLSDKFSAGIGAKYIYSNLASGQTVGGQEITVGQAGAADVSFTYQSPLKLQNIDSYLRLGLAITNIGSKITYTNAANEERDFIPTNLGIGAAWDLIFDEYNTLSIITDINKLLVPTPCFEDCDTDQDGIPDWKQASPIDGIFRSFSDAPGGFTEEMQELMLSFGLEYWYDKVFAVRAGYYTEAQTKGARRFFTVGLGLRYNVFGLNFSYLVPTTNQRNPLDNTLRFSMLFDLGESADTKGRR